MTAEPTLLAEPDPSLSSGTSTSSPRTPGGDADTLPERLGRYVVLELLGEGGMGVVFTAYDPELDRKVAIKLLRTTASGSAQDRLVREAQAMAKLSHPNVVPVFDVGQYEGRVFVAMDYVPGASLRAWLDAGPRPWREVVDVFVAAGRGLAHAHAHELVHRDFKPDNVIVGDDSGERRVQVLDFGLAKSVEDARPEPDADPEAPDETLEDLSVTGPSPSQAGLTRSSSGTGKTLGGGSRLSAELTHAGSILGTPAYMSPEQHRGAPTTAASDQFSFCVALYEALWGKRPFAGTTLKALAFAVVGGKLEPPPSSSKVPSWIWPIVARGLAVDPAARWPSMPALLAALEADPGHRRRQLVVGLTAAAAFVGAIAWGLTRTPEPVEAPPKCQGAATALAEVWTPARATALADRYAGLEQAWAGNVGAEVGRQLDAWTRRWAEGRTGACEATELRGEQSAALMDLRMACYDRKLDELAPTVELLTTGDPATLAKGVELVASLPDLELCADAESLRAAVPPPQDADARAEVAAIRTVLAESRALAKAGQPKPALALVEPLVARAEATAYPPVVAEVSYRRGALLIATGDIDAGRTALEAASMAAIATRDDDLAGSALEELISQVGYTDGDYEGGLRWARLAQALLDRSPAPSQRRRAKLAENLGMVEFQAGHFEVAREQIGVALALLAELDGPDHPSRANPLNVLGATYLRSGDYRKAGELFERSLAITERAYGPTHPQVAFPLNNLALVHERLAEFDEAAAAFERVLVILEAGHGEAHPNVGLTRMNLGGILLLAGRLEPAGVELARAVEILEAALGAEHQIIGRALTMRGDWERESGKLDEALASYARSVAIRKAALGEDHPDLSLSLLGTGRTLLELGRTTEAVRDLDRAVALLDSPDADPIDRGQARFHLARALTAAGTPERVAGLLDAARADYESGGIRAAADLATLEAWAATLN